ncbi:MAG TPA: Tad domain-containing protein, partial [Sphingomonas sp.]|nr:Tad domain-containing protein [Sphingomonas sp.]
MGQKQAGWTRARGFLSTLARDTRANTLAMMAMALIPLAGMVGGGIDISRMYIVKTRLQHACDAGALAGRKAMGSGAWSQTVNGVANYPRAMAEKFFVGNYDSTAYGATGVTKSFAENAGKVTGTASATVPMTLMRIFGKRSETLSVACDAEMRLPNTDVMFVLDTTGSMNDVPSGDNKTKMAGLKIAVKCFYQILSRLDVADTDCEGPEPSGGTGGQIQIRFGFVPYATNVNVGRLLKPEWIADSWFYQSRELTGTTGWSGWTQNNNYNCWNVPANTTTVQYRTQG